MNEEVKFNIDSDYVDWIPVKNIKLIPKHTDTEYGETRCVVKEVRSEKNEIVGTVVFIPYLEKNICIEVSDNEEKGALTDILDILRRRGIV